MHSVGYNKYMFIILHGHTMKQTVYTLFFSLSSKCSLFHNSNIFGSCIIHILCTGCAKNLKKNNSNTKRLMCFSAKDRSIFLCLLQSCVSVRYDNWRFRGNQILRVFKALTGIRNA